MDDRKRDEEVEPRQPGSDAAREHDATSSDKKKSNQRKDAANDDSPSAQTIPAGDLSSANDE